MYSAKTIAPLKANKLSMVYYSDDNYLYILSLVTFKEADCFLQMLSHCRLATYSTFRVLALTCHIGIYQRITDDN